MTPGGKGWTVSAHRQSLSADHTFLKVLGEGVVHHMIMHIDVDVGHCLV